MKRLIICTLALLFSCGEALAQGGIITTVAGRNDLQLPTNIPATIAPLSAGSMATGPDGSLYGFSGYQIFKISPAGILTVVGGNGDPVSSGDGGPALLAGIYGSVYPGGLAVDRTGNIYIAESAKIRKIDLNGIITIFAGINQNGFSGDGGPATEARIQSPVGVACDSVGNLYIADNASSRIRRVTLDGIINTFAGDGTPTVVEGVQATSTGLPPPGVLAIDTDNTVYVSGLNQSPIYKIAANGIIVKIANPPSKLFGLAVHSGVVYFSDQQNVYQVTAGVISIFAGGNGRGAQGDGGPATAAQLLYPAELATDTAGNVFISDGGNSLIRRVDSSGVIHAFAGSGSPTHYGDGLPATSAYLNNPSGITFDPAGNLIIADCGNHQIAKVDSNGIFTVIAGTGFAGAGVMPAPGRTVALNSPSSVAADANFIYIADSGNLRVLKLSYSGTLSVMASNVPFSLQNGNIVADQNGSVYYASPSQQGIFKISASGAQSVVLQGSDYRFTDKLAISPSGVIYFDALGLVIDKLQPDPIRVAGNGTFGYTADGAAAVNAMIHPGSFSVDAAGNVYFAENFQIRRVSPGGILSTIAGTEIYGFSGDGGRADAAQLSGPGALYADANNNLYFADAYSRIRKITGVITHGTIIPGTASGGARSVARIPLSLSLTDVAQVDGINFTISVTPVDSAPALAGTLAFQQGSPSGAPVVSATSSTISVSWTGLASPLADSNHLGDVLLTIPAGAPVGSVYQVTVTAAGAGSGPASVALYALGTSNVNVILDYLVGDASPATANDAANFGDGTLNSVDLIQLLRAATSLPGYLPPACSDRFDAMDAYPADTASTRGGDGILDTLDLLTVLRRVSGVDTSAPHRVVRGSSCLASVRTQHKEQPEQGRIEVGAAEFVRGVYRAPVYVNFAEPQNLLTFGFSVQTSTSASPMQFLPAAVPLPTLSDSALPGAIALAWLDGLSFPAGQVLIGYVQFPRGSNVRVHGANARSRDGAKRVRIGSAQ